jgi:hypothetical protein
MDMYVRNSIYTMLAAGGAITDIPRLLRDTTFRDTVLAEVADETILDTWAQFSDLTGKEQRDETRSTYNKFHPFLMDYRIRRVFNGGTSFNMSDIVNDNMILIVSLPQGHIGMGMAQMIGSLLLSQVHVACLGRTSSVPFEIVIEEAHTWAASIIREMLTGLRKFATRVTVVHQSPAQFEPAVWRTIVGNCPEKHIFRLGQAEGELFDVPISRHSRVNIDELPDFTYRKFPVVKGHEIGHVLPLGDPLPRSRSDIEKRMGG